MSRRNTSPVAGGPDAAEAGLLDVQQVAKLLRCSPRHVYRMAETERMPAAVRLGVLVRWSRRAVIDWIGAGCPAMYAEMPTKGGVR